MSNTSPQEAYSECSDIDGHLNAPHTTFICPHCRAFTQQMLGRLHTAQRFNIAGSTAGAFNIAAYLAAAECINCRKPSLFFEGNFIWPNISSAAPKPAEDMPESICHDFEEARQIYTVSPRGAAALLRLCVEKLLCGELNTKARNIDGAIGELVAAGRLDPDLQQAADALRVIGNEAVHPGTMDLKDNQSTAFSLFQMINFIVERTITYPKRAQALYSSLPPGKLDGIKARDSRQK